MPVIHRLLPSLKLMKTKWNPGDHTKKCIATMFWTVTVLLTVVLCCLTPVTAKKTPLNDAILKRNEKPLHVRHFAFLQGMWI